MVRIPSRVGTIKAFKKLGDYCLSIRDFKSAFNVFLGGQGADNDAARWLRASQCAVPVYDS